MAAPNIHATAEARRRAAVWSIALAGVPVAIALAVLLDLLGLAVGNIVADPFQLTQDRVNGLVFSGGLWFLLANVLALEVGVWIATRARRFSSRHRGALLGLTVWSLAFMVAGVGGHRAAAETLATTSEATALALQGDEEISPQDLERAVGAARDVANELAWWGGAGLALGVVGACLGRRNRARTTLPCPALEQTSAS